MGKCPYKECASDHYDYGWLDEILFLDPGLDLTRKEEQYPLIYMKDLHKARANIIIKIKEIRSRDE